MKSQTATTDEGKQVQTIDVYDTNIQEKAKQVTGFSISDEGFILKRNHRDPSCGTEKITFEIAEKAINQYTLIERSGESRSGPASSKSHHDRLLFVVRNGATWKCYKPEVEPHPSQTDKEYIPTQIPGVAVKDVLRTRGSSGSESRYKEQYKLTPELVESFDSVWMLQFRTEKGGSQNGDYYRIETQTATRLTASDE